jgi:hypothetical protein
MGTGFTLDQVQLLESDFSSIILLFDGDSAGSSATLHSIERLIDTSLLVLADRLEDKMDPQEYLEKYGVENLKNRQEVRETYYPNGAIFIFKYDIIKEKKYYTKNSYAYIMPKSRSVDIDTIDDFLYAEFLLNKAVVYAKQR